MTAVGWVHLVPGQRQLPSDPRTEQSGPKGKEPLSFSVAILCLSAVSRVALLDAIRLLHAWNGYCTRSG